MPKSVTISARIDRKLDSGLAKVAKAMGRSKSWALSDSLADYLEGRRNFIDWVEKGRRDFAEDRIIDHDDVVAHFDAKRGGARKKRRAA